MSVIFMLKKDTKEKNKEGKRKRRKRKSYSLIKRIRRKVRKNPFKILSAIIGGILLIVITILFIMYSIEAGSKKTQLQKTEAK